MEPQLTEEAKEHTPQGRLLMLLSVVMENAAQAEAATGLGAEYIATQAAGQPTPAMAGAFPGYATPGIPGAVAAGAVAEAEAAEASYILGAVLGSLGRLAAAGPPADQEPAPEAT